AGSEDDGVALFHRDGVVFAAHYSRERRVFFALRASRDDELLVRRRVVHFLRHLMDESMWHPDVAHIGSDAQIFEQTSAGHINFAIIFLREFDDLLPAREHAGERSDKESSV